MKGRHQAVCTFTLVGNKRDLEGARAKFMREMEPLLGVPKSTGTLSQFGCEIYRRKTKRE